MECLCKTCKTREPEDGEVRCRTCHKAFRRWLDGGEFYVPMWNGLVSAPADSDDPKTRLDRALAKKRDE
jgi:hypothetical protein